MSRTLKPGQQLTDDQREKHVLSAGMMLGIAETMRKTVVGRMYDDALDEMLFDISYLLDEAYKWLDGTLPNEYAWRLEVFKKRWFTENPKVYHMFNEKKQPEDDK